MLVPIWFMVSEETRLKMRALMPAGWRPPEWDWRPLSCRLKLESLEEVSKIMRRPPRHIKRGKSW